MKKSLGYLILSLPPIAVFVYGLNEVGFLKGLLPFAIVLCVMACMHLGAKLFNQ